MDMNFQPRGISDLAIQGPATYQSEIEAAEALLKDKDTWNGVKAEAVARMRLQNRFKTGLDVARYTAALMRADMAAYDADCTKYTQSLGCWHGFIAQQKLISVKKHFGKTDRRYLYLSGWMIAALRSEFGPLPDQSMHEKTSVPALIEELYTFLRQADSRELNDTFRALDAARKAGDKAKEKELIETAASVAHHRLKTNFILERIAEQEKIEVRREDVDLRIRQEAQHYNISSDKMRKELEEHDGLNALAEQILLGKTLDFLKANVSVQPVSEEQTAKK